MSELLFNDLLMKRGIDPAKVVVMRDRPFERELAKVLPWLAADKPDLFNAYQQTQGEKLERTMRTLEGAGYVASFIGHGAGKALFVGIYRIAASRPLSREDYWKIPAYTELNILGIKGFTEDEDRETILWFDLNLTDAFADWKGKLVIGWPPPERSWCSPSATMRHIGEIA